MAQFNFLDANGLNYYHTLLKTYIDTADAESIKYITFLPQGNTGNSPTSIMFWKDDPTGGGSPAYTITLPDFEATYQHLVSGSHQGEVVILDANGQVTYSGVTLANVIRKSADTGATFTEGQVATFDSTGNAVKGTTLADVATSGEASDVSFVPGTSGLASTDVQGALEELAAASGGGVASKTVYITETAGGPSDLYSKRYGIYQGATGSSASPVPAEKLTDIDIPKDMVVEDGSVVEIFFDDSDDTLHEGSISGPDVTEAIMGPGVTPTAADAGKYIKLVVANATSTALYIKATDLVDIYTGGTTSDGTIAISASNEVTFTLSQSVHGSLTLADNSVQKGWTTTAPTADNLVAFNSAGAAVDSGIAITDVNTDTFAPIANSTIDQIVAGTYTPTT
jgi:hypothetical protein